MLLARKFLRYVGSEHTLGSWLMIFVAGVLDSKRLFNTDSPLLASSTRLPSISSTAVLGISVSWTAETVAVAAALLAGC